MADEVRDLFRDVFPALHRYCIRSTHDSDVAQDVAQEAFVRLVEKKVVGSPAQLRVWLFRVATHLLRDRHRVQANRRRLLTAHPPPDRTDPTGDRAAEAAEAGERVHAVLAQLADRDREMLLMRYEGFRYREIAEAIDVAPTSVGTLLARAEDRFARLYRETQANHA